jgi:transcriptional regulator with XRE-family HTH domain
MKFCEKLRALRKQHGLKQSDLAKASGLTTNKIQRYEQRNQMPRGEDALALARALHVVADYLLDDALPFPPPEECLSEKVVIIRKLEGLLAAMTCREDAAMTSRDDAPAGEPGGAAVMRPDVIHLPVLKLGAGFLVEFDAVGLPSGDASGRDMYFDALGDGTHFAAELHGSSMQGPGGAGFARGEIVVFRKVEPRDVASGDYVYVRTDEFGLFRQVFTHGETIRLRAKNPADPEIVIDRSEIRHIGRLVRRVRDY